jgi:hypothetical protein
MGPESSLGYLSSFIVALSSYSITLESDFDACANRFFSYFFLPDKDYAESLNKLVIGCCYEVLEADPSDRRNFSMLALWLIYILLL